MIKSERSIEEEEFANKILVEVLSQMDRDRKAEEEKD